MRKPSHLLFVTLLFALSLVCAQVAAQALAIGKADALAFKEMSFDFGGIQQGRPTTHNFTLKNTGTDTLLIQNVQASCGCTTPVWSKEPVAPGATAEIQVGYNAASDGKFEKNVTVFYNGGQTKVLTIKGDVYRMPSTPAPTNTVVQLLKQTNQ